MCQHGTYAEGSGGAPLTYPDSEGSEAFERVGGRNRPKGARLGCITFRDGLRLASSATTEQVFAKIGSPDAKAFTTLTQGYLKHQDVAGALRVLETALEQRVQVSRCGAGVSISGQRPKLEMQLRRLAFSLGR